MRLALAAALLLAAAPATADSIWAPGAGTVWERATAGEDDPDRVYQEEMQRGDEYTKLAMAVAFREKKLLLDKVERAYENAIAARPDAAEPHLRLAELKNALFLQGMSRGPYGEALLTFDRRIATNVLDHWYAFEQKAPLDPRITDRILFERAIVHTKMGTDEHYEKALADYRTLLDRSGVDHLNGAGYLYNAAETLMMLGRLDEALPMYEQAMQASSKKEYAFSMAVALDRDGQGARARELLERHVRNIDDLESIVGRDSGIFFVPAGELYYYRGLTHEVIDEPEQAIIFYDKFIQSGAHPRFHERAREHITRLRNEVGQR